MEQDIGTWWISWVVRFPFLSAVIPESKDATPDYAIPLCFGGKISCLAALGTSRSMQRGGMWSRVIGIFWPDPLISADLHRPPTDDHA
jgi:hypothetical protein